MSVPGVPRRDKQRPPIIPGPPSTPRGPKWEQSLRKRAQQGTGPGKPPDGFVVGTTSGIEWVVYWAIFKALAPNRDPRTPPFWGLEGVFRYQKAFDQGRQRGGTVLDYLIEYGPRVRTRVGIRLQTTRHHEQAGTKQIIEDRLRKHRLVGAGMVVVDLNDYEVLLPDGTPGDGSQAVIAVKRAIGMIETASRLSTGTARDVRYRVQR